MAPENSSASLQKQMRSIRRDLNEHADQMVAKACTQFDWRHFVADHPWTSLGAAAAAGYLLAPRATRRNATDAEAVKETVDRLVREAQPSSPPPSSIVGWLIAMAAPILIREGVSLIPRLAHQWLDHSVIDQGVLDRRTEERPVAAGNGYSK